MALQLKASIELEPYLKKYYLHCLRYNETGQLLRMLYHSVFRIVQELAAEKDPELWKRLRGQLFPPNVKDLAKKSQNLKKSATLTLFYPPLTKGSPDDFEEITLPVEMHASMRQVIRESFINDLSVFCTSNMMLDNRNSLIDLFYAKYKITVDDLPMSTAQSMIKKYVNRAPIPVERLKQEYLRENEK